MTAPGIVHRPSADVPAKPGDPAHSSGTVTMEPLSVGTDITGAEFGAGPA